MHVSLLHVETCLPVYDSLWTQEYSRPRFNVVWKNQTLIPKVTLCYLKTNQSINTTSPPPGYHNCSGERMETSTDQPLSKEEKLELMFSQLTNIFITFSPSWAWRSPLHRKWSWASMMAVQQASQLWVLYEQRSRTRSPEPKPAVNIISVNIIYFILNFLIFM